MVLMNIVSYDTLSRLVATEMDKNLRHVNMLATVHLGQLSLAILYG